MADEVIEVSGVMEVPIKSAPLPDAEPQSATEPTLLASQTEDLMVQYGLSGVLSDLRARKLRSSFMQYISELPTDKVPLKPRCPAGQLMEIAAQPVNEDERRLELFDERVLRKALVLKETGEKVKMPEWLDIEQSWGDDDKRKRRKDRRKKKKKKKRKREREEDGGEGGRGDDDERRRKKRR